MSEEAKIEETTGAENVAQSYVEQELVDAAKSLKNTQIYGSLAVFGVMCWLFSIAGGFASNLEPKEAAKIAKGLAVQQLEVAQPQVKDYLAQEIPAIIESVPEYALGQLPIYRESVEQTLEDQLAALARDTSGNLDQALDVFLAENEDQFKTIILAGQDQETTDDVAREMRYMFLAYLTEPGKDGESIQDKLDESLKALRTVEHKTARLASATNLSASEKQQRRAIASLFKTVQDNRDNLPIPSADDYQNQVKNILTGF